MTATVIEDINLATPLFLQSGPCAGKALEVLMLLSPWRTDRYTRRPDDCLRRQTIARLKQGRRPRFIEPLCRICNGRARKVVVSPRRAQPINTDAVFCACHSEADMMQVSLIGNETVALPAFVFDVSYANIGGIARVIGYGVRYHTIADAVLDLCGLPSTSMISPDNAIDFFNAHNAPVLTHSPHLRS